MDNKSINKQEIEKNKEYVEKWRNVPGDLDDFIFYKEQNYEVLLRSDRG
jgi:hypothetical protein